MNQSEIMQLERHCQDMAISRRISLAVLDSSVLVSAADDADPWVLDEIKQHVDAYAHHLELLLGLVRLAQDKLA